MPRATLSRRKLTAETGFTGGKPSMEPRHAGISHFQPARTASPSAIIQTLAALQKVLSLTMREIARATGSCCRTDRHSSMVIGAFAAESATRSQAEIGVVD